MNESSGGLKSIICIPCSSINPWGGGGGGGGGGGFINVAWINSTFGFRCLAGNGRAEIQNLKHWVLSANPSLNNWP